MNNIKRMINIKIPMSICNFRCNYCYLAQRDKCYQGIQPEMRYTPEQVGKALSKRRLGGAAFVNMCADGETLLTKDIDLYIKAIVEEGNYVEIVTNLTCTSVIDKILLWESSLLQRVEFKASFHYLELKKRNLLDTFSRNANKIWEMGSSVNIEITPCDELVPYIEEVKEFSIKNFGALPHLSIARDDRTKKIDYLTNYSMEEYDQIWGQFDSSFWRFKKSIFGIKRKEFCYAGLWSLYINLATGYTKPCYCGKEMDNFFENTDQPYHFKPIGSCTLPHCYNGHAFLTLGLIPQLTKVGYGDIRDRKKINGEHWLQQEYYNFINTKFEQSYSELNYIKKMKFKFITKFFFRRNAIIVGVKKTIKTILKLN